MRDLQLTVLSRAAWRVLLVVLFVLGWGVAHAQEGESPIIESCSHYDWKPTCSAPPAKSGWYLAKTTQTPPQPDITFAYVYCRISTGLVQYPNGVLKCVPQQCEANAESVNGQCQCKEGFEKKDGACVKKPDDCPQGQVRNEAGQCVKPVDPYWDTDDGKCNVANNLWNAVGNPDRGGRVNGKIPLGKPTNVCVDSGQTGSGGKPLGCLHEFTGSASFDTGSGWVTEGDSWGARGISTGTGNQVAGLACALGLGEAEDPTKPIDASKPDSDCKGGQKGQVNGKDVCIDRSSGEQTGVDWTRIRDTAGNSVDVTTQVDCKRETCTVTETRKPSAGGESTVTVTNGVDRANYCNANPKNPVCRGLTDPTGSSRGNGTNTGNGTGNGNGNGNGESEGVGDVGSVGTGKEHGQPDLYESKYPKGIKGVWEASGLGGDQGKFNVLARAFMPDISDNGGSPLSFKVPLNLGIVNFGIVDVSPPPAIWPFIRICILITALWLARSLIFGG
ncbi:hypothetical protein AVKW3434_22865 [Acidovorax sp. SUPP3434]|uniref:hypothetical protein n=1 Tax=Acidovorax sp. SUPP3434 TaxID=2920880 RepID=UPI0023DE1ABA|nr:hypothetical protein [Acidovorax sp. SUPP3434]GKT02284.1 hypothetical protein AVKW3434_22865 [Acidovorax sp. SUPP3434]